MIYGVEEIQTGKSATKSPLWMFFVIIEKDAILSRLLVASILEQVMKFLLLHSFLGYTLIKPNL